MMVLTEHRKKATEATIFDSDPYPHQTRIRGAIAILGTVCSATTQG